MTERRAKGEGTIYQRKDKRWVGMYTVNTLDGTKRRAVYGKSKKEVRLKLTEAIADRDKGLVFDSGTVRQTTRQRPFSSPSPNVSLMCPQASSAFGPSLWAEKPIFCSRTAAWKPPTAKSCLPSLGGGSSVGSTACISPTADWKSSRSSVPLALALPENTNTPKNQHQRKKHSSPQCMPLPSFIPFAMHVRHVTRPMQLSFCSLR